MIGIFVAIVAVLWGALAISLWLGRRERRQTEDDIRQARLLSPKQAEMRARELLGTPGLFETRRADSSQPVPMLPEAVASLLSEYEEVTRGEFCIGRAFLNQPSKLPGHVKVGEDFEFTEMFTKPSGSRVYTVYGESPSSEAPEIHDTVWHKLIEVSEAAPSVRRGVEQDAAADEALS